MEQNNEQVAKLTKVERLQQSIDEIDMKINQLIIKKEEQINELLAKKEEQVNKLLVKKEELKEELENAKNYAILDIINSKYKTLGEVVAFIKQANGDYEVDLVKKKQADNQTGKEEEDEFLANDTSEV